MALTLNELASFQRFAEAKVANSEVESLQELVEVWEMENPTPEEHAENVAAIRAAIRDMEAGDTGRPAREVVDELRNQLSKRQSA